MAELKLFTYLIALMAGAWIGGALFHLATHAWGAPFALALLAGALLFAYLFTMRPPH